MAATDERINELESRLAFQEDTIDLLNDTVTQQQKQIDDLTQMVKIINRQLKTLPQEIGGNSGDEPPPPHY
ncbi:MAG: SlyX family protein [Motiliproteus sp.]|nr:SlyX family protein [Motiliproteus sp.]MCW9052583.1 SlyX family protein [Motiliproteus sp.]